MRYATPGAFRAALEARLKDEQSDGVGMSRLRKRIVFERLLARLQVVAPVRLQRSSNATHEPPGALVPPPRDWVRPWATLVKHLPADADLTSGFSVAAVFWNPVLASEVGVIGWDPELLAWTMR